MGDVSGAHHYADPANGTALSLKAGTDMDCGDWGAHAYLKELPQALSQGLVQEADLDRALVRLTRIQMDLGLFDPKEGQKFFNSGIELVHSEEHRRHALEAAHQSIVLLRNEGNLLPLKAGSKVAVIGPHAFGTEVFLSNYHGSACLNATGGIGGAKHFDCIQTPLAAINATNAGGHTTGMKGCAVASACGVHDGPNCGSVAQAAALAKAADYAVLVVGIDGSQEAEGHDRHVTNLTGVQPALVEAVLAANPKTIMVLVHGGAMSLGPLKNQVPAIVDAFYGGEMAAQAMADVLFGHYNPSGKLAITMYPPDFVDEVPLTQMAVHPVSPGTPTNPASPGRTHMYHLRVMSIPTGILD